MVHFLETFLNKVVFPFIIYSGIIVSSRHKFLEPESMYIVIGVSHFGTFLSVALSSPRVYPPKSLVQGCVITFYVIYPFNLLVMFFLFP